jgi:hypothetical protein
MYSLALSIVYMSEGLAIISLNVVLAISILLNKSLRQRKELVFIVGLSIADTLYGAACTEFGRDKLFNSVLSNTSLSPTTPWSCFWKPREFLIYFSSQVSMFILCSISAERLFSVAFFNKYASIKFRSHLYVLSVAFLLPFILMAAAGYETFTATKEGVSYTNDCRSYSYVYFTIIPRLRLTLAIGNVLLYAVVLVAYKTKVEPISIRANAPADTLAIRNKRLTKTLALIIGAMLIFYCFPLIGVQIMNRLNGYSLNNYFYTCVPLQYIAYVLIFYWRQNEIRQSVKEFICCKAKITMDN